MLGKLFKYDMKALLRILLPLHGAVLLLGVVSSVCGFIGYTVGEASYSSSSASSAFSASMALLMIFGLMAIFSAMVATLVIIIHRFYKNLFTDEGYLTFTLPVTANQILLSKVLAGLLWLFIDAVVITVCSMLISLGATGFVDSSYTSSIPYWILSATSPGLSSDSMLNTITSFMSAGVQLTLMLIMAYLAFTLGATLAARHKVAAGIGMYVVVSWLVSAVTAIVNVMTMFFTYDPNATSVSTLSVTFASSVIGCIVGLLAAAGCYVWCVYLLKNKVNLA